ncbi:MAG: SBBP repeat-containing protein, partial [Candidatus Hodarchaeota archaeon]
GRSRLKKKNSSAERESKAQVKTPATIENKYRKSRTSQVVFIIEDQMVNVTFSGSNRVKPQGKDFLESYSNYFYGTETYLHIRHCQQIVYENLYGGITLIYKFTAKDLKYDFIVDPYAHGEQIQMCYSGLDDITVTPNKLQLTIADYILYDDKLQAWYELSKDPLAIQFRNGAGDAETMLKNRLASSPVCFAIEDSYDRSQRIIIDPLIWTYSTYFGGHDADTEPSLAFDTNDNIVIVGTTTSSNFPTSNASQQSNAGRHDAFIAKFSTDGQSLLFSTYFGGSSTDRAHAVTVDAVNNILISGTTYSTDLPTLNPYQPNLGGIQDAFISKFSPDGQSLLFSSYFGGSDVDRGWCLSVDPVGNLVLGGYTSSNNFPTSNASQQNNAGNFDAFVAKFSADGQSLLFSTYFGGSGDDYEHGLAIDAAGNILIAGGTTSGNLPTVNAFQPSFQGGTFDAFVAKFSANNHSLLFASYLGGSVQDYIEGAAFDASGNIIAVGATSSVDFVTWNASQENNAGNHDIFITKFSADGQSLIFSTFFGGDSDDYGYNLALDATENIIITGHTTSSNLPTMNATQEGYSGDEEAYVTKISADGQFILFSSYIGGSSSDIGYDVATDTTGNILVSGTTDSVNFPVLNAYQPCSGGGNDIFLCKYNLDPTTTLLSSTPSTCIQATTELTTSTETSTETNSSESTSATSGFEALVISFGLLIVLLIKRKKCEK